MSAETNGPASVEGAPGADLVRAAETLAAQASGDPRDFPATVQPKTAAVVLELRPALPSAPPVDANVIPLHGRPRARRAASDPGA